MSSPFPTCPACHSSHVVENGSIYNGKQNHKCENCERQFVQDPQNKIIDEATKHVVDKRLPEKLPLAGITRVAEVSEMRLALKTLQDPLNMVQSERYPICL